jgi:hypothetical protein
MSYTIELEKLTDVQLEAFKVIDLDAYKAEKENRSTYTDEDMKKFQIYTDLDKAYYYLKPMYDNMRNTDVKKTITESGILTTLEKVFRWTKKNNVKFERFAPASAPAPEPVKEKIPDPIILQEGVKPEEIPAVVAGVDYPVTKEEAVKAEVIVPIAPIPQEEPKATVVDDKVVIPATQSTLEAMSMEELNKIMESIPAVEKI